MLVFAALAAFCACTLLIFALKPLLKRYALARPNARSSHKTPTPQGGGIAILGATFLVGFLVIPFTPNQMILAGAALALALIGLVDDIRPLPAAPRLLLQALAVAVTIQAVDLRIAPDVIPLWLERAVLTLAGLWFVNLINFMDGLDWITVAELVPPTAFIAFLGGSGLVAPATALLAACLCGALLGFAPFNKPIARLFLGDVGSLPLGLLVGWLLLQLASGGGLVAALLLPLYPVADATITLFRRLVRGERIWEAHRTHFYQQATKHGFSALSVSSHVFGLNCFLVALAALTLAFPYLPVELACCALGTVGVGLLLRRFARPRHSIIPAENSL